MRPLQVLLSILLVGAGCSARTGQLVLPEATDEPVTLRVNVPISDAPTDWSERFAVYVDDPTASSATGPVQGTYRVARNILTFHPDFPFSRGVKYRVEVAVEFAVVENIRGVRFLRPGHGHTTRTSGRGTMKRPPRSRNFW